MANSMETLVAEAKKRQHASELRCIQLHTEHSARQLLNPSRVESRHSTPLEGRLVVKMSSSSGIRCEPVA